MVRGILLVVSILILVIFVGGSINLGSAPLFGHIDRALGISLLMDIHHSIFSMMYRGEKAVVGGAAGIKGDIDDVQQKAEASKARRYQKIERAGEH